MTSVHACMGLAPDRLCKLSLRRLLGASHLRECMQENGKDHAARPLPRISSGLEGVRGLLSGTSDIGGSR